METATQISTPQIPIGLLIIGRKRPGFDQEWNRMMCTRASGVLTLLGYRCIGAEEAVADDAAIQQAFQRIREACCDTLLILQPSMGNGQLSLAVMQQWDGPVILWATPERQESEKVSSCSLVGQHLWASILRNAGRPFEIVYGDPSADSTCRDLSRAMLNSHTYAAVRRAKVGAIGGSAPGFLPMAPDLFMMKRDLGAQLVHLSLGQFIERVRAIDNRPIKEDLDRVQAMNLPMRDVRADDLPTQSRYYLALRQLIQEEGLDALAVQDWPELPEQIGHWPYLAMSRLADDGFPIAMEGDADAAILCLIARHLNIGPGFITDWLEHDDRTMTFWHAGTAPLSMCGPIGSKDGPVLARHFNIERPMCVDAPLRSNEPVTIARLWRCDGRYHMTAFQGHTIRMRRKITGNSALVEVEGGHVTGLFDALCHAGFPHHPVVFFGHQREPLRRLARMLRCDWVDCC